MSRKTTTSVPASAAVCLTADDFTRLFTLSSLAQVGACIMAVGAYAYGTSLDFAHAMADCDEEARSLALHHCRQVWKLRHTRHKRQEPARRNAS